MCVPEDIVIHKLNGERLLVLTRIPTPGPTKIRARRKDLSIVELLDFEVELEQEEV